MEKPTPEVLAERLFYSDDPVAQDVLVKIYADYGGLEAFSDQHASAGMKSLRNTLLKNKHFPRELYIGLITNAKKFTAADLDYVAYSPNLFADYSVFKKLWDISPEHTMDNFYLTVNSLLSDQLIVNIERYWSPLPPIHAVDCKGDEPGNVLSHWGCETHRNMFLSDVYRAIALRLRETVTTAMAPGILELIQSNSLTFNGTGREDYAANLFVRDDHWVMLASDPRRGVINRLAENCFLPTAIARQLILEHKTPFIRESIAHYTVDSELLQTIWDSTKSEATRKVIGFNPFFTPKEGR